MKLLTHNLLQSHIKGVTKAYPLGIEAEKVEVRRPWGGQGGVAAADTAADGTAACWELCAAALTPGAARCSAAATRRCQGQPRGLRLAARAGGASTVNDSQRTAAAD